jgi:PAS domain S-box-containing protein
VAETPGQSPATSGRDGHSRGSGEELAGWISRQESQPPGEDERGWIRTHLLNRILAPARSTFVGQLFFVATVSLIIQEHVPGMQLLAWVGVLTLAAGARSGLPLWARRRELSTKSLFRIVRSSVLASGILWGAGIAWFGPGLPLERLLLVMTVLTGMTVASAVTLAPDPAAFRRFGLPILTGATLALLGHGRTDLHWLAIALVLLFGVWAADLLRQSHQAIRQRLNAGRELDLQGRSAAREREYLVALLQSFPDAVLAMEEGGRILGVNRGFTTTFGWEPHEVLGRDLFDLIVPPEEQAEAREEVGMLVQSGATVRDVERLRKDGNLVHVRTLGSPIEEFPGVVALLYSDISILKDTESALARAKQAAEAASEAKSEFLATMSHEIRTPMNAILGMGELLSETELTLEQAEYVKSFSAAGDTLLSLINQILDLSRIEADQLELHERAFDLTELADQSARIFTLMARKKGLELEVMITPDVPRHLTGDPERIRQVIVNLLGNALKFTSEGSVTLSISLDPASGSMESEPFPVRFEVVDTGPGIPEDRRDLIFERFTQADSSISRTHGGSGLGLTIASALTRLMGGKLEVESAPGEGSRFHFTLPLKGAERDMATAPAGATHAVREAGGGGHQRPAGTPAGLNGRVAAPRRILLVEDTVENRVLVEAFLKGSGHDLVMTEDGEQALRKYMDEPASWDLILMDIQMPGMDGYEATRRIRSWERDLGLDPVPIVSLTAHAMDEERTRSLAAGCNAHMTKPIRKDALLAGITEFSRPDRGEHRPTEGSPAS